MAAGMTRDELRAKLSQYAAAYCALVNEPDVEVYRHHVAEVQALEAEILAAFEPPAAEVATPNANNVNTLVEETAHQPATPWPAWRDIASAPRDGTWQPARTMPACTRELEVKGTYRDDSGIGLWAVRVTHWREHLPPPAEPAGEGG